MKPLCLAASLAACLMTLLATQPSQAQTYDQLYSFKGSPDGAFPYSGVIRDSKGNLYGTSPGGGIATFECGKIGALRSGVQSGQHGQRERALQLL